MNCRLALIDTYINLVNTLTAYSYLIGIWRDSQLNRSDRKIIHILQKIEVKDFDILLIDAIGPMYRP